jgi:hypothetical protein
MGYLGGSTFRFLRRQEQWRGNGNGSREIEPPPEQPERSAADEAWLRANIRKEQRHDEQQGESLRQSLAAVDNAEAGRAASANQHDAGS